MPSTTEEGYMNQDDDKQTITVKLYVDNDIDILEFNLGDGKVHKLNLNSEDNQDAIKSMFCDLILLVEASSIELTLDVDQSYDNALLKEVATSYISDLNGELEAVRTEIATTSDVKPNKEYLQNLVPCDPNEI